MDERFYRSFYRIRRVEEEIARVYPTDKIKSPVHLAIGQEAVSVGVCAALAPGDVVSGTYRSHALYLAKGGDLGRMLAELYAKATGCARGKGGSMHLVDPAAGVLGTSAVVGTTIPIAVGYAYASKVRGRDTEVLRFRDEAFTTYFTSRRYLDMVTTTFGPAAADEIRAMTAHRLERRHV